MAPGPEQQKEAPKDPTKIMGDFMTMPKPEELSTRDKSEKSLEIPKDKLNKKLEPENGYKEATKTDDTPQYDICKNLLLTKMDEEDRGKWISGFVAKSFIAEYKPQGDKDMMEVKSVIMVSGNKPDEYLFAAKTELVKPTPDQQKKINEKKADSKKETDEGDKTDDEKARKEYLAENLKNPDAAKDVDPSKDDLAKKVNGNLKEKNTMATWNDGKDAVVGFWTREGTKIFKKGPMKTA